MQGASELLYEVADGVARLTINRPERRNALSWAVMQRAARRAGRGQGRSRRPGGGAHRRRRQGVLRRRRPRRHGRRRRRTAACTTAGASSPSSSATCGSWASRPSPGCAGYALAGGFGLALACDLVVASDDAEFGTPEIDVGLWPYMITVPLHAVDAAEEGARADDDRPPGRRRPRRERIGFVTRVVPVDELDAAVDELAARSPSKSPPVHAPRAATRSTTCWDRSAADALPLLHAMLTVTTRHRGRGRGHRRLRREAPARLEGTMIHVDERGPGHPRSPSTGRSGATPSTTRRSSSCWPGWPRRTRRPAGCSCSPGPAATSAPEPTSPARRGRRVPRPAPRAARRHPHRAVPVDRRHRRRRARAGHPAGRGLRPAGRRRPRRTFGVPAAKLGLMTDQWTMRRLAGFVGQGPARAMCLAAETFTGADVHRLGFVQRLAEPDALLDEPWPGPTPSPPSPRSPSPASRSGSTRPRASRTGPPPTAPRSRRRGAATTCRRA